MKDMVSVIIPTFGGDKRLNRAIKSVLAQTYNNFEIIVVDDNDPKSKGRKDTEQIMSSYDFPEKVIYIKHEKNINGSAARNTGIRQAKGDYICFLDDDDIYLPERLERSVEIMNKTDADALLCGVILNQGSSFISLYEPDERTITVEYLLINMDIGSGSNIFLRRSLATAIYGFDDNFARFQDIEFMIRVAETGKINTLKDILIIKDNSTNNVVKYEKIKTAVPAFLDKFQNQIKELDDSKEYEVVRNLYFKVYVAAKLSADKDNIRAASSDMFKVYNGKMLGEKIRFVIHIPLIVAGESYVKRRVRKTCLWKRYLERINRKNEIMLVRKLGKKKCKYLRDYYEMQGAGLK